MSTKMFSFFERVVLWLSSGKMRARVEAESGTSVTVHILDDDGCEIVSLDERKVRDILDAMRRAKAAARAAVVVAPTARRGEED